MIVVIILAVFYGVLFLSSVMTRYLMGYKNGLYEEAFNIFCDLKPLPEFNKAMYQEFGQWEFENSYMIWFEFDNDFKLIRGVYIHGGIMLWFDPFQKYWHNKFLKQATIYLQMIYYCGTSLSYFFVKWADLRLRGIIDLRWFSIGNLYFICDSTVLNSRF